MIDRDEKSGEPPSERSFARHRQIFPNQVLTLEQIEVGRRYLSRAFTTGSIQEMVAVTGAYSDIIDRERSIRADFRMSDGSVQSRSMHDASVVPYSNGLWNNVNILIRIPSR